VTELIVVSMGLFGMDYVQVMLFSLCCGLAWARLGFSDSFLAWLL